MVALYKDKRSPYWYYDMPDPTAPNGRKRKSTRRTAKVEAKRVAEHDLRKVQDRDQLGARDELTLSAALSRYLKSVGHKADIGNIASRIAKILGQLPTQPERWHLNPAMMFHDLTTRHIDRLREARRAEGNAEQTINHELKVLSATHNLLRRQGARVSADVAFTLVKVPGKLRWLTEAEEVRLLAELLPDRVFLGRTGKPVTLNRNAPRQRQDAYDLVVFLLDTGCRYGEVGEIPWAAIDTLGWHWVDIYRSKTGNSDMLTMTARLKAVLRRRYAERSNSAYVFPTYAAKGGDRHRGKSTQAIRRAIQRAGLNTPEAVKRGGRVTTHTLRDTFASRLVQAGVSLYKVQRLLGHADPRMTMKYAKLEPRGVADEAAAVLDALRAAE